MGFHVQQIQYPKLQMTGEVVEGRAVWRLVEEFCVEIDMGPGRYLFVVHEGTTTDLGSVPRLFWWVVEPTYPKMAAAFIVHDLLYEKCLVSRFFADALLRELSRQYGAPWWKRTAAYWAVRLCGWVSYGRNRQRQRG